MGAKRKSKIITTLFIVVTLSISLTAVVLGTCSAGNSTAKPSPKSPSQTGAPSFETPPPFVSPSMVMPPPATTPVVPSTSPATSPTTVNGIVYKNSKYRFTFDLPKDWAGYKIVTDKWVGNSITGEARIVATGPKLLIRNPKWTAANPMQDIPIMVFTIKQWDALQREEFAVSAAPIGPSELGRNSKYVFALPARYNFSFLPGYEDVEDIMNSKPLHAYDR